MLALVFGLAVSNGAAERGAALARLATIAIVLLINVFQLRGGFWKRPPLYFISTTLSAIAVGYVWLLAR